MHCEDIQRQLEEYLDGNLPIDRHDAISGHLQSCAACRQVYSQSRQLRLALQTMPVAPPRAGYTQRVLSFLPASNTKSGVRSPVPVWFGAGFATAVLAVFAVWFMLSLPGQPMTETISEISLHVAPQQVRTVALVFNSPNRIQQATLRIELPAGVELKGYANQRVLQWQTELDKGSNRLMLPLIAKGHAGGMLTASISHQGKTRTFKVNVVNNSESSQRTSISQTV